MYNKGSVNRDKEFILVLKVSEGRLRPGQVQAHLPMLAIYKPGFIEKLAFLKAAASVSTLRSGVSELIKQLNQPETGLKALPGADTEANTIELSRTYLLEELQQIAAALTLERSRYYVERLEKALTKIKTSAINDINLNRWKEYEDIYTDSLWIVDRRDKSGVHRADYWGNFIPQIPNQLMKRYTKKGDWVLDTFAGSGTTMIESQRLGRNSLGVELQPAIAARTSQLVEAEPNQHAVINRMVQGDSATISYPGLLGEYGQRSAQLVIMHPPYFDIIKFSDNPQDLSNASSVETFLQMLGQVVENAAAVLDKGRYLALVIGDKFSRGEWIPLGFLAMNEVNRRGFTLKSIIVKNFEETAGKRSQKELWKYRALVGGFYIFKHEYIFIFKKK